MFETSLLSRQLKYGVITSVLERYSTLKLSFQFASRRRYLLGRLLTKYDVIKTENCHGTG